jgi:uncharacterized protein YkwD
MRCVPFALTVLGLLLPGCDAPRPEGAASLPALPALPSCDPVREWSDDDEAAELELLARIDAHRRDGAHCGEAGRFGPSEPLQPSGRVMCAARLHALDMAEHDFVGHVGSNDSTPWDRLRATGLELAVADQVVGAGEATPDEVVDALWIPRVGSCAALLAAEYTHVGVGWVTAADDATHPAYFVAVVMRGRAPLQ